MRYFIFLSLFLFHFSATCLSAATYELDLEEYFPNQAILKTLTLEAEILHAEVILNDGSFYAMSSNDAWPAFSEIQQVTFSGPTVNVRLTTQNGYELTRSTSAFKLEFLNELHGEGREVSLNLTATPIDLGHEDESSQDTSTDLSYYLLKSFLLGNQKQIRFAIKISTYSELAIAVEVGLEQQSLHLEFLKMKTYQEDSWKIIVKNPIQDIENIAKWMQMHGVDQLAMLFDMPSISYYGNYFPKYFAQALILVLTGLGEPQANGTLHFVVTHNTGESFQIAGIKANEIGFLFIQKIKDSMGGWWGY